MRILTLTLITLLVGFYGCLTMPTSLAQSSEKTMTEKIQSPDFKTSTEGLLEAKSKGNISVLLLGLKHPILEIQAQSVDLIQELNARNAVPALIAAWMANQGRATGGSGIRIAQAELNQKLAIALAQLTEQTLDKTQTISSEKMQLIVQNSRIWATQHNLSLQQ